MISDIRLEKSGKIFFDPLDHNGYLGDIQPVNGVVQPFLKVERRKYRFRILFGSNARWFLLRLSTEMTVSLPSKSKSKRRRRSPPPAALPMLQIANDSWLLPEAIPVNEAMGWPAHRVDLIIDFTNAPRCVYLENVFEQEDGRGPEGDLFEPDIMAGVKLLKFIVSDEKVASDVSVTAGTKLRPHNEIKASDIMKTRKFVFEKESGAWQINDKFFDPCRADATPTLKTAERWILENDGDNWWHPIHIHLESHQLVKLEGKKPPRHLSYKSDTTPLGGDTEAEILMHFRTFKGPFVFHCHNIEHEDMRMMFNFDPHVNETKSPQPIQQFFAVGPQKIEDLPWSPPACVDTNPPNSR